MKTIINKTLFHFHLKDAMGNKSTLICKLINGAIEYIFYGGIGTSGIPFSLSNIQFYTQLVNGHIEWKRDCSLPIENLQNESEEQFKDRVKSILNNSTDKVIKDVNTDVMFTNNKKGRK